MTLNFSTITTPVKRSMVWVWGISAILVFAPESLHQRLGLAELLPPLMPFIGLVFISLAAVFIMEAVLVMLQSGTERSRKRFAMIKIREKLAMLDHEEKAVLREFFIQRKHTVSLPFSEPAVISLMKAHVLHPINPNEAEEYGLFSLNQYARPLLTSKVLNLPTGGLTEDHIRYIKSTRPAFVIKDNRPRNVKAA